MIYPDFFERKIGFTDIRTLLKGRCMSTLGTDWVDNRLHFLTAYDEVREALDRYADFARFSAEGGDEIECEFFDVREALVHARPERTYMEELDLYNLRRSLATAAAYAKAFTRTADGEEDTPATPAEIANSKAGEPDGKTGEADGSANEAYGGAGASPRRWPALARMAEGVRSFPDIIRRIDEALNKYGKVKDTASPELLTIRHQIETTTRGISHSLRSIISEAQTAGYVDRDISPTLRDGRLVIPVAPALKRKIRGIVHDESATGKTVFIEPTAIVEANNRIRELKAAERREVIRILHELTAMVRPHITEILDSQRFLSHIDYLRALHSFAATFGAVVPALSDEPRIDWAQAVHPLLQQSLARHGGKMTPLDISLPDGASILIISGPNAGGKSVCLKTAGLLQYMLQCGMPVPAGANSRAGVFEDIFIDIGDEQSLEDDLSTYSSHLLNMKQMMRSAGPRSLLLIDEFGGGTEPQIGGALAEAILDRFVRLRASGIITTHYQNLKHFAEKTRSVANGAMLYDRAKMQPLFMLQVGNPGSSFAIEIARKIGLPEEVIARAAEIVGQDYVMSDKYLQDIVRDKMYWETKRRNIRGKEKQLEEELARYEREMTALREERRTIIAEAKEEAKQLLRKSNALIENTVRAIREAQAEKEKTKEARATLTAFREEVETNEEEQDRIARKIAQIRRRQERRGQGDTAKRRFQAGQEAAAAALSQKTAQGSPSRGGGNGAASERPLAAGDYVRIKGQNVVGRIDSIGGRSARVLFGMMYTQVETKRLERAEAPAKESGPGEAATFLGRETRDAMYEKKLHYRPEIDIRGMHVDEALQAVSYFIDDSIQLEQGRVRILHGTGTGALRELVRNYLGTVAGVRSYRDEHVQFGGAGVTVAELD